MMWDLGMANTMFHEEMIFSLLPGFFYVIKKMATL